MKNSVINLVNELHKYLTNNEVLPVVAQSFLLLKRSGVIHLSESIADGMLCSKFDELNKQYQELGYHLPIMNIKQLQPFIGEFITNIIELYKVEVITDKDLLKILDYLTFTQGKNGLTVIPNEVVKLGKGLLPDTKNSIYCPFDCSYYFAEAMLGNVGYESKNGDLITLALVRAELMNKSNHNYDIRQSDPLSDPKFITQGGLEQFDHVIGFLPFNLKLGKQVPKDLWGRFIEKSSNGYVYQLRHMLAHSYSHVIAFVSNQFLTSSIAGEVAFKQDMLDKGWLKAVISLPSNLLNSTGIPFSIIILDKSHHGKPTLLIDANNKHFISEGKIRTIKLLSNVGQILDIYQNCQESDYSVLVTSDEIKQNNMSLMPSRYVITQEGRKITKKLAEFKMVYLADIAEFIRPQMLKSEQEGKRFNEVVLSNLNEIGQIRGEFKQIFIKQHLNKVSKQELRTGDILLSSRGTVGRVGLVNDIDGKNMIANQIFTVIRIKSNVSITPEFIYQYLVSDLGQWQLSNLVTGSSQPVLSPKDLNALKIPKLSLSEIKKAKNIHEQIIRKYKQLEIIRKEIKELENNAWFTD